MGLNKSAGNMYDWITDTWNTVKGACPHDCSYCYMKRWGKLNPIRFDEKELKTDLGKGNFIFVGSSCDMFAEEIPIEWIIKTVLHCSKFDNRYLFQTKNPKKLELIDSFNLDYNICLTVESNRYYKQMGYSPHPIDRVTDFSRLDNNNKYVTIEPIMEFDLSALVSLMEVIVPVQINIGADSGNNNLPEPGGNKIRELVSELEQFTKVKLKKNLNRLLKC